jgi:hypothetical protein
MSGSIQRSKRTGLNRESYLNPLEILIGLVELFKAIILAVAPS